MFKDLIQHKNKKVYTQYTDILKMHLECNIKITFFNLSFLHKSLSYHFLIYLCYIRYTLATRISHDVFLMTDHRSVLFFRDLILFIRKVSVLSEHFLLLRL